MIRAYVYKNKDEIEGKVMVVENSIEVLRKEIALCFHLEEENVRLFSYNGCEISDIRVIRDNEKIYVSTDMTNSSLSVDKLTNSIPNLIVNDENIDKSFRISDWITLNIGGKCFTTSRSTLVMKEPLSMLARMFSDDNEYSMSPSVRDSNGAYLIDRSPAYFEPILNYLRHGDVILDENINPKGVLEEAIFFG